MGGMSLLAGKPKAGKTTLARSLALAVARGEPWLGFKTAQGAVFYLALEEKRTEVRRHFQAMGAIASDPIEVFIAPSPHNGVVRLRAVAEQKRPVLIIVDPLLRMIRVKDANDYAIVLAALEPLLSLARETGAHVLAVHHLGKGDRGGGDGVLGSTAFFGTVDTALLLKRSERYRTLSSLQRYGGGSRGGGPHP
jgi:RecA-family ATPase